MDYLQNLTDNPKNTQAINNLIQYVMELEQRIIVLESKK